MVTGGPAPDSAAARRRTFDEDALAAAAAAVPDPELPQVTVGDLGIMRGVRTGEGHVTVTITPTYSGCPALDTIRADITAALVAAGVPPGEVRVRTELAPPWSSDDITEAGRRKLADAGIAPPGPAAGGGTAVPVRLSVRCPHCGSTRTAQVSRFSATACKALYRCAACTEPFEHLKAI